MRQAPATTRKAAFLRQVATVPERVLWQALRNRQVDGLKFRRKVALCGVIVDFYLPAAHLVVEVTGKGQHLSLLESRDGMLRSKGYGHVRFAPEAVEHDLGDVLRQISQVASHRI